MLQFFAVSSIVKADVVSEVSILFIYLLLLWCKEPLVKSQRLKTKSGVARGLVHFRIEIFIVWHCMAYIVLMCR